jgi:membrane fusion protein
MHSLFRQEVLDAQHAEPWSDILLVMPVRYSVYIGAVLAFMVTVIGYLIFSEYSRKQTALGYLVPDRGVVNVVAPRGGIIREVQIQEGDTILARQPLAVLETREELSSGSDVDARILAELQAQKVQTEEEIKRERERSALEMRQMQQNIVALKREIEILEGQLQTQRARVHIAQDKAERYGALLVKRLISDLTYAAEKDAYLTAKVAMQELEQRLSSRLHAVEQNRFELQELPIRSKKRLMELQTRLSDLSQREAQVLGQRAITLRASVDGKVAFLNASSGVHVQSGTTVLSILPMDSQLEVRLFVPARAIGFIEPGQDVYLHYDAFPFQRYGVHKGKITSVSSTILRPQELSVPLNIQGPVYQVRATLEHQTIAAYGKQIVLQAGMTLMAKIHYDTRSLLDWILDPLYSLRGKPNA